ncbi:hypothetical protein HJG60_008380 [Phyllostomus discolor]|uniref:Uncharacterized protein n=1 Tax=Phyllostomus discolor TaxID=89673 RepID=A0A833Z4T2_9CHIR|nr:hypothetical protein HJG60_008380 [Phyllostomus discolor]
MSLNVLNIFPFPTSNNVPHASLRPLREPTEPGYVAAACDLLGRFPWAGKHADLSYAILQLSFQINIYCPENSYLFICHSKEMLEKANTLLTAGKWHRNGEMDPVLCYSPWSHKVSDSESRSHPEGQNPCSDPLPCWTLLQSTGRLCDTVLFFFFLEHLISRTYLLNLCTC